MLSRVLKLRASVVYDSGNCDTLGVCASVTKHEEFIRSRSPWSDHRVLWHPLPQPFRQKAS